MNLDKETQEKIQELQILEQNMHSLIVQKQAFQLELSETENALSELSKNPKDVYKMIGKIMILSEKNKVMEEIKKRKELVSLRLKSIEKQEDSLNIQNEELRKELMKKIK